jgi:hypothetical protein
MKLPKLRLVGITMTALLTCSLAHAGSIQTPTLASGEDSEFVCTANNVTNAPIAVTVKIFGALDNSSANCTMQPNDNGCAVVHGADNAFCRISVNGLTGGQVRERVRGALFSRSLDSPFRVEGVAEAR